MPAYEWTCNDCGAKIRGLGSYNPDSTRQPCKKFVAKSPDSNYHPLIMSTRCLFSDPKLIDISDV